MVLARWPDRSVKWLLLDACVTVAAHSRTSFELRPGSGAAAPAGACLRQVPADDGIVVHAEGVRFLVPHAGGELLRVLDDAAGSPAGRRVSLQLCDESGRRHRGRITALALEESGPVRIALRASGRFGGGRHLQPLTFDLRLTFLAGSACAEVDVTLTNTCAARHRGGLWDLGDEGSCLFRALELVVELDDTPASCRWYAVPGSVPVERDGRPFCIYQDSSGGENWRSANHVDAGGKPSVRFRGYKVFETSSGNVLHTGERAEPALSAAAGDGQVTAALRWFWQNFPSAIGLRPDGICVGLFPFRDDRLHELQGGERKRQTAWLDFGPGDGLGRMQRRQRPLAVMPDPAMSASSGAVPYLAPMAESACRGYVDTIVDGPHSFIENREIIDEYGWRNFGDLYADHEAVNRNQGPPLVSHYNNQYDFLHSAGVHFLRTGDARWYRLMEEAAWHTMDIDMYHTREDRAAYNGGLFWHTDHYKDARTATHRTYSQANGDGAPYGGGPSNEHNYTSGLLLWYYLSGDVQAREAVRQLADWVIAMDDGSRTPLSVLNSRPTGLASRTVSDDYHKPGRGAGNSINALLDAYTVCGDRAYMAKAEELVQRCIHPEDDIEALGLDEPEYRWSYLVFLQVLGKYLGTKSELGERDYLFHYARASLLHYADWMLGNEVPYKDVLHKLELPTETWPAQDIRKCHVMHLAAAYCGGEQRALFAEKAKFYYERCISDLLGFDTALLTRPRVIIAGWGHVHDYFERNGYGEPAAGSRPGDPSHDFGSPQPFVSQRDGLVRWARTSGGRVLSGVGRVVRRLKSVRVTP